MADRARKNTSSYSFFFLSSFSGSSGGRSGGGGSWAWTPAIFRTGGDVREVPEARLLPFLLVAGAAGVAGEGVARGLSLGLAPVSLLLVVLLEDAEAAATSDGSLHFSVFSGGGLVEEVVDEIVGAVRLAAED